MSDSDCRHRGLRPRRRGPLRPAHHAHVAAVRCLRYGVFSPCPVTVVLVRDHPDRACAYDRALVTTDLTTAPVQVVERYAARWSVEVWRQIRPRFQVPGVCQDCRQRQRSYTRQPQRQLSPRTAVDDHGTQRTRPSLGLASADIHGRQRMNHRRSFDPRVVHFAVQRRRPG